jgi:hypothetical protein
MPAAIPETATDNSGPNRASLVDSMRAAATVLGPSLVKGVMLRRQAMMHLVESFKADQAALDECLRLRDKYGPGPLTLSLPGRPHTLILSGADARAVLEADAGVMSASTDEKRSALGQFEPKAALISEGAARAVRRAANEDVLRPDRETAPDAGPLLAAAEREGSALAQASDGRLSWPLFHEGWARATRATIFGPQAVDDQAIMARLDALRAVGNWAFVMPDMKRRRTAFHKHLARAIQAAPPRSLAGRLMASDVEGDIAPEDQIAHWLFAADAVAMAGFRCLALLASSPDAMAAARAESERGESARPLLRAALCEALRLWPTTPLILRRAKQTLTTANGVIPAGAEVIVFAPLLHRDPSDANANRFAPELWSGGEGPWPYVPFSAGQAGCPARHLVPMLGGAFLAGLLRCADVRLADGASLTPPLPATLDHTALSFEIG